MNYFEIINKALIELNYREVTNWEALTLNDHKRLKDIISRLNSQICASYDWPFLQRYHTMPIPKHISKVDNPVEGRIEAVFVDSNELTYSPDYKDFVTQNPHFGCYAAFAQYLYFPPSDSVRTCEILYNTDNSAISNNGQEKRYLESQTDQSLIQEVFQEPLLVYGACMRLKSNPEHNKFKYWYSMYTDALATMRAMAISSKGATPTIKVNRT